jgi:hypothetical protein
VAAGVVALKVATVTAPTALVILYGMLGMIAVELDTQILEVDALWLIGIVICLLDIVDHAGIEHLILLKSRGKENAQVTITWALYHANRRNKRPAN